MSNAPAGAKKPTDRKKPAGSESDEFVYETGGGTITLPPFSKAFTVGFMRKNRDKGEVDTTFALLEQLCDADELDLLDAMDLGEFQTFQEQWQAHSDTSMGESPAS